MNAARRLLLVAFHFPPVYGSGVQRLLSFARNLPGLGWNVDILTISTSAVPASQRGRLDDIPAAMRVMRACGLDSARHLSLFGRYPLTLSLPDRWVTWRLGGLITGLSYIREVRPDAIMSSFPIATAHLIARDLHALSNIPWLADFRDPMAQDEYPKNARIWRSFQRIEERTVHGADALTFTASSAIAYYRNRYGAALGTRCHLIPNGYDSAVFDGFDLSEGAPRNRDGVATFLHSGLLYPWERDPLQFFRALLTLEKSGFWSQYPARFVFRASGFDDHYRPIIAELGLGKLVEFRPTIDYADALREMCTADGLLLFQAANSNFQIPAKTYEYLRTGRPILGVVDRDGDTAALLAENTHTSIASISSDTDIVQALRSFVASARGDKTPLRDIASLEGYSRENSAAMLAHVLESIV